MKKIMFNDRCGLTEAVLSGRKTQTRRIAPKGTPFGSWKETEAKARFKVGEIVAVAQSYHTLNKSGYVAPEWLDHSCESSTGYKNKMFVRADLMPHRIRITNVRVERLQDISEEDCIKEGVYMDVDPMNPQADIYTYPNAKQWFFSAREAYASLIDKVSGEGTWDSNPFIFVYDFELVK